MDPDCPCVIRPLSRVQSGDTFRSAGERNGNWTSPRVMTGQPGEGEGMALDGMQADF